jgi:hypothetical protein
MPDVPLSDCPRAARGGVRASLSTVFSILRLSDASKTEAISNRNRKIHSFVGVQEMMFLSRILISTALLSAGVSAFTPSYRSNAGVRSKTDLHMSAALIVQNKGGGHGELGELMEGQVFELLAFAYSCSSSNSLL